MRNKILSRRRAILTTAACVIAVSAITPSSGNKIPDGGVHACFIRHMDSGTVVCRKNPGLVLPVASITKIVTVMTVLEEITKECHITVPKKAEDHPGHGIGIRGGEIYPCREFLRAMLVGSGNDAARAAAIFLAGSDRAFADRMNRWCRDHGLKQSRFVDPHGFSARNVSSARDLSLLLALIEDNRFIRESLLMETYTLESRGGRKIKIDSTNVMLSRYAKEGILLTGKTGFTLKAGHCFAGFLEIKGGGFLFIVLGAEHQEKQIQHYVRACEAFLKRKKRL